MSNIYVITVAFCPAAQLARCLFEFGKESDSVIKHIIVNGHYPINNSYPLRQNERDLKLIVESYGKAIWMDPGKDLGSAQSQNWVLDELCEEITDEDFFINLDPDASCRRLLWTEAMLDVMEADEKCAVVSCNAPMIDKFIESRHQVMEEKKLAGHTIMLPDMPTPFNLSMWRASFFRSIGGIPQKFPWYGEVEGPVYAYSRALGYYNCYLKDYYEDEQGKLMHDRCFEDWKDAHARTMGPEAFLGSFKEYCLTKEIIDYEDGD